MEVTDRHREAAKALYGCHDPDQCFAEGQHAGVLISNDDWLGRVIETGEYVPFGWSQRQEADRPLQ